MLHNYEKMFLNILQLNLTQGFEFSFQSPPEPANEGDAE